MSRDGYQPDFDIDLGYGKQGEMFVEDVLKGAADGRTEVKRDAMSQRTGNLYVEFECLRRDGWHRSGIATTKADYYAFVLGDSGCALLLDTDVLRSLAREQYRAGRVREETDGSHPTRGVLLPLTVLMARLRTPLEVAS